MSQNVGAGSPFAIRGSVASSFQSYTPIKKNTKKRGGLDITLCVREGQALRKGFRGRRSLPADQNFRNRWKEPEKGPTATERKKIQRRGNKRHEGGQRKTLTFTETRSSSGACDPQNIPTKRGGRRKRGPCSTLGRKSSRVRSVFRLCGG